MRRKVLLGLSGLFALLLVWIGAVYLATLVVKQRVPISLPPMLVMNEFKDQVAIIEGTWSIESQKSAFPLQLTRIYCEMELRRCTAATARIGFGDQLVVDLDTYEIKSWQNSRIVFVDEAPSCAAYTYTADFLTKTVNGVRRRVNEQDPNCKELEPELRLTLRRGFEVWRQLEDDALPWFGKLALFPIKLLFH